MDALCEDGRRSDVGPPVYLPTFLSLHCGRARGVEQTQFYNSFSIIFKTFYIISLNDIYIYIFVIDPINVMVVVWAPSIVCH